MKFRENLALIADIATIVGVSFVWLMGKSIFAHVFGENFNLFDIFNALLFAFIVLSASSCILLILYHSIKNAIEKQFQYSIVLLVIFLVCASIATGTYPKFKHVWANIFFNEFLLPTKPEQLIEAINTEPDEHSNISGNIELRKDCKFNPKDFVVHVYEKFSDDANYRRSSNSEFKIGHNLSFVASKLKKTSVTQKNTLQGVIIVIARDLDNLIRDRVPREISGANSIELKEIGAYVQTFTLN